MSARADDAVTPSHAAATPRADGAASPGARAYASLREAALGWPEAAALRPHAVTRSALERERDAPEWVQLPGPQLAGQAMVFDSRRDRIIAMGGGRTWVLSLGNEATWSELVTPEPSPHPTVSRVAVYDSLRDRVILFGGWSGSGGSTLNDVWSLSLSVRPAWSRLDVAGPLPPGRVFSSAIYDPVHDAMIVFGGEGGRGVGPLNDLWSLSLGATPAWHKLEPPGAGPTVREGHTATYDPLLQRMILFGGWNGATYFNDLWVLSLGDTVAWHEATPPLPRPGGRVAHSMVYDPIGDRMLVLDGAAAGMGNDLWALSLAGAPTWSRLTPVNGMLPIRAAHAAVYDPIGRRMIVVGGASYVAPWWGGTDTWALALVGDLVWAPLVGGSAAAPEPRWDQSAVYDPVRERMVIFGGYAGGDLAQLLDDTWVLPLQGSGSWGDTWDFSGTGPRARSGHSAIYDPVRDRMIVFGGQVDDGDEGAYFGNDLWAASFSAAIGHGVSPWTRLAAGGAPPSPRVFHRSIYDPDGDRMLVYGGYDGADRADLWELSLAGTPTWTELHPDGVGPGSLVAHSMVYDSKQHRMLVFGGGDTRRCLGETWALSLGRHPAWSLLMPETDPRLARVFHSAVYDEQNRRMVVWGGFSCAARGDVNDCWALDLKGRPEWHELRSANEPPEPREGHTAIYDAANQQMVIFAGNGTLNDAWALPLPPEHGAVRAVADDAATPVASATPTRMALSSPRPNPVEDEATVEFALPEAGRVSLAVYDAAGRRVRRLADGVYAPGTHGTTWQADDDAGRSMAAGLYFVRLESKGTVIVRKVVLESRTSPR